MDRRALPWIVAILVIGALLRFQQTVVGGFPLGDGGLFTAAVDALRTGGLPATIGYNGGIPFVYPPLGLLVGGGLAAIPGVGTETVMRFLPALLAVAALGLVPHGAFAVTGSRRAGVIAVALLAVTAASYDQLLAAAGVTRGLGVLLALAAVAAAASRDDRRGTVATGVLLGLAALTHPRIAMFALASVGYVWWRYRSQRRPADIGIALGVAAILVLPWLLMLASRGQLGSLLSGGQRLDVVVGAASLLIFPAVGLMHGGLPDIGAVLALAGVVACLFLCRWDLLVWLVIVHLLNPPPYVSAIAFAFVGAAGIATVIEAVHAGWTAEPTRQGAFAAAVVALVAVLGASASPSDPGSKQQALAPQQVEAARAMSVLPEDAQVAVVTSETWGNDLFGEWLPSLSGRTVITTPQGSEWLGRETFGERLAAHEAGQSCVRLTSDCLATAIDSGALTATHIVIPRGSVGGPRSPNDCCPALVETIRRDPRFEVVLDADGALVAAWR